MTQESDIRAWAANRKAELIKRFIGGQTTIPEAARCYNLTRQGIENWMDDAETGMEKSPQVQSRGYLGAV